MPSRVSRWCTRGEREQRGDGRPAGRPTPRSLRYEEPAALVHRLHRLLAEPLHRRLECALAAVELEQRLQPPGRNMPSWWLSDRRANLPAGEDGAREGEAGWHWSGVSSSVFPSGPVAVARLITSDSRWGSMAGLRDLGE
jgi:hypothetical protein